MLDRRGFLGIVLGGAACALGPPRQLLARSRRRAAGAALDRVGLQLYTVRGLMAEDFERTLERVAAVGYREVEFAGYFGRSPARVREAIDRTGLAAPAAHVSLEAVRDDAERTFDAARRIGHRYLVVPWIPAESRRTVDGYRRVAELLNRAGERAAAVGLRLGYHNHAFEFARIDGVVPYDVLLADTDPEHVAHEMDLYWVVKGGGDPIRYFSRFPRRFELVHVKDMDATADRGMADPGRGTLDFARLLPRARAAGVRHFFVEHDRPASPMETIRIGYEYLRALEI